MIKMNEDKKKKIIIISSAILVCFRSNCLFVDKFK